MGKRNARPARAFLRPMDIETSKKRYRQQRNSARERGIEWRMTFREWLDWWGDDLDRRGRGKQCLGMQRIGDVGPYSLDNIRKGTPKDNAKTRGAVSRAVLVSPYKFKRIIGDTPVSIPA